MTADLYYFVDGNSPDGPHALSTQVQSLIYFDTDGTFKTHEDDLSRIGNHELRISASLVSYPAIVTTVETVLPLEYVTCDLTIYEWALSDVVVPVGA